MKLELPDAGGNRLVGCRRILAYSHRLNFVTCIERPHLFLGEHRREGSEALRSLSAVRARVVVRPVDAAMPDISRNFKSRFDMHFEPSIVPVFQMLDVGHAKKTNPPSGRIDRWVHFAQVFKQLTGRSEPQSRTRKGDFNFTCPRILSGLHRVGSRPLGSVIANFDRLELGSGGRHAAQEDLVRFEWRHRLHAATLASPSRTRNQIRVRDIAEKQGLPFQVVLFTIHVDIGETESAIREKLDLDRTALIPSPR